MFSKARAVIAIRMKGGGTESLDEKWASRDGVGAFFFHSDDAGCEESRPPTSLSRGGWKKSNFIFKKRKLGGVAWMCPAQAPTSAQRELGGAKEQAQNPSLWCLLLVFC